MSQAFLPGTSLEPAVIPPLRFQTSHCSTFRIMCDVPSIAVFCTESIEYFPGIVSKFFFKLLVTIPVAPIITGIIVYYYYYYYYFVGRDSSVGTATHYGLDDPGIKFRWGRDFPHLTRPVLRPTQLPIQWVPGLSLG